MMKNEICVALGTIITILVITLTIDLKSIKMTSIPLIILKEEDGADKVYYGILYNTYNCSLNKKVTIKLKMTKYSCPVKTSNTYIIEDESKLINNFTCNEVLDEIYKDSDYSYNLIYEKARKRFWIKNLFDDHEFVEEFSDAEERKVFYVALTRTKKDVYLLTPREKSKESPFVRELLKSEI